jgi:hypothetical protein
VTRPTFFAAAAGDGACLAGAGAVAILSVVHGQLFVVCFKMTIGISNFVIRISPLSSSALHRLYAAEDFHDFAGDLALASPIVVHAQGFDQFVGIIGG